MKILKFNQSFVATAFYAGPLHTYIVLRFLLRVSVEMNHLTVVPSPVPLLDIGQVEASCPQPLLVAGVHLGNAAVVGGWVQEVCGAVGGIIVIPERENGCEDQKIHHMHHVKHESS